MKKFYLFLIAAFFSCIGNAQENVSANITFNHVALSVKDVNRSAEFYKKVLGLQEITNRTKKDGIRWFSLGEDKELHLISTIRENVIINKAVHFALKTAKFDAFVTALEQAHVAYADWEGTLKKISIRADGIKQVFFQDPDGYWIEVNSVSQ